jgi:glycosyltransferase involved in cell wall biosynthesis
VQFLGHTPDVPVLLANSGVFAFPSLMEASPNAVIEAMAAGLAIAASNAGGIPEVVSDGRNGLLVPPGDPVALADALSRLITDPDLCRRLGEAARETIGRRFSFDQMVGDFERLYVAELRARAPAYLPRQSQRVPVAPVENQSAQPPHRDGVPHPLDQLESKTLQ